MFGDAFSAKALFASFAAYLVVSVVAMAIVVNIWLPVGADPQEIARMAETDPTLLLWQNFLGTFLGVLAGALACYLSGANGLRNSTFLGGLFVLYGVLGIYLHPGHPAPMQAAKLLAPIPLTLAGGWLCMLAVKKGRPPHSEV